MRVSFTRTLADAVLRQTILHLLPDVKIHKWCVSTGAVHAAPHDEAFVVRMAEHPLRHAHAHPWSFFPADGARSESEQVQRGCDLRQGGVPGGVGVECPPVHRSFLLVDFHTPVLTSI